MTIKITSEGQYANTGDFVPHLVSRIGNLRAALVILAMLTVVTGCGLNPSMDWRPSAYAEKACVYYKGTSEYPRCYSDAYMTFTRGRGEMP